MKKKAISGIITAVLMIALVMAAASIVWVVVNNIVTQKLDEAGSCFDVMEKIKVNDMYTCYNRDANGRYIDLQFSVGIDDVDVKNVLVSISGARASESFTLSLDGTTEDYLGYYGGTLGEQVFLPNKKFRKNLYL